MKITTVILSGSARSPRERAVQSKDPVSLKQSPDYVRNFYPRFPVETLVESDDDVDTRESLQSGSCAQDDRFSV